MDLPEIFICSPTVYIFDKDYQIMVAMDKPALVHIRIGEQCYWDHFAGTLRSEREVHRIRVPQEALDQAGEYTVCWRTVIDRTPYFPKSEEQQEYTVPFSPVPAEGGRFFHASDVHGGIRHAIAAAQAVGAVSGVILNGDIPNFCDSEKDCMDVLRMTGAMTGGEIPVIFARGNHDSRGRRAEILSHYIPHREGRTYFTFRLGNIWGLVLDCGEDKPDTNKEYNGTVCFHSFRLEEDRFIREVLQRAEQEYEAPGVCYRVVISHHPFSLVSEPPFDIETELYGDWCRILREEIKPDLMISGHTHRPGLFQPGGDLDQLGQAWPIGIGGRPADKSGAGYVAAVYDFLQDGISFALVGEDKELERYWIPKAGAQ